MTGGEAAQAPGTFGTTRAGSRSSVAQPGQRSERSARGAERSGTPARA